MACGRRRCRLAGCEAAASCPCGEHCCVALEVVGEKWRTEGAFDPISDPVASTRRNRVAPSI